VGVICVLCVCVLCGDVHSPSDLRAPQPALDPMLLLWPSIASNIVGLIPPGWGYRGL
jgi:hypothetical protein